MKIYEEIKVFFSAPILNQVSLHTSFNRKTESCDGNTFVCFFFNFFALNFKFNCKNTSCSIFTSDLRLLYLVKSKITQMNLVLGIVCPLAAFI